MKGFAFIPVLIIIALLVSGGFATYEVIKIKNQDKVAVVVTDQNIAPETDHPIVTAVSPIIECGTLNLSGKSIDAIDFDHDPVLSCLGKSVNNCTSAIGRIQTAFYPSLYEVKTNTNTLCSVRLTYELNPVEPVHNQILPLKDKFIECPKSAVDLTYAYLYPKVTDPKTESGKYSYAIWNYEIASLYREYENDPVKIKNLGCYGTLVDYLTQTNSQDK